MAKHRNRRDAAPSRPCTRKFMSQLLEVQTRLSRANGHQRPMTYHVMQRLRANALARALAHAPLRPRPRARHACADVPAGGPSRPEIEARADARTQIHAYALTGPRACTPTTARLSTYAHASTRPRPFAGPYMRHPAPKRAHTLTGTHARVFCCNRHMRQRAPSRAPAHTKTHKHLNRRMAERQTKRRERKGYEGQTTKKA